MELKDKLKIYVAGPYTKGDVAINVRSAIEAGNTLRNMGHIPWVPHFSHFWHMIFPHEYQYWLDYDNEWIPYCDALLRLPGESSGADAEVDLAVRLGLPIYYDISEIGQPIKRFYLCGPMTKYRDTDWGYARFNDAARKLRANGFHIINPAENFSGDTSLSRNTYLSKAFAQVASSDGIIRFSDWNDSEGAKKECQIAEWLGKPIYEYEDVLDMKL